MKSGNGIPARCVYLEEMAADLDDQDWLDMDNVEQVGPPASRLPLTLATGMEFISSRRIPNAACSPKPSVELPGVALPETATGFWGYEAEKGLEFAASSPSSSSSWRLRELAAMQIGWGWGGERTRRGGRLVRGRGRQVLQRAVFYATERSFGRRYARARRNNSNFLAGFPVKITSVRSAVGLKGEIVCLAEEQA